MAMDPTRGELYVLDQTSNAVRVFNRADTGNVAPLRSFTSSGVAISNPQGMTYDPQNDEAIVSNGTSILVFARTASGATAPLRTITGAATTLSGILPLCVR